MYYTVEDIMYILGIGRSTAYKLVKTRGFPSMQIGKQIRIDKEEFDIWRSKKLEKRIELECTKCT